MSLYEKYHSDLNHNHMFNVVKDIVNREFGIVLEDVPSSKDDFQKTLIQTFSENKAEDLITLNKSLINNYVSFANKNYPKTDMKRKYDELMETRNKIFEPEQTQTEIQTQPQTEIQTQPQPEQEEQPEENVESDESHKELPSVTITSSKRLSIHSSRFYHTYNLKNLGVSSDSLRYITRIILPFETTYIFSHPIIQIRIQELNYQTYLQKTEEINHGKRIYCVYESFDKTPCTPTKTDTITVDIRDVSGVRYKDYDIVKVNIIHLQERKVQFQCSEVKEEDFKIGDQLKVINSQSKQWKQWFTEPLLIESIDKNKITCNYSYTGKEKIDESVDMKLLNISNQNVITFN
jgi:hypothetical protein